MPRNQGSRINNFPGWPSKTTTDPEADAIWVEADNTSLFLWNLKESEILVQSYNNHDLYTEVTFPQLLDNFSRVRRCHKLQVHRWTNALVLLYHAHPSLILTYPLKEHLCIKGLWFPILTEAVKDSYTYLRNKSKMASEPPRTKPKQEAEQLGLKICLMCTQSLFENRQSLPERTFEKVMDTTKKVLGRSQRDAGVRSVIPLLPILLDFSISFEICSLPSRSLFLLRNAPSCLSLDLVLS